MISLIIIIFNWWCENIYEPIRKYANYETDWYPSESVLWPNFEEDNGLKEKNKELAREKIRERIRENFTEFLYKEIERKIEEEKRKPKIEDMVSTQDEIRRELVLEIEENEKTNKAVTAEGEVIIKKETGLKRFTKEELDRYANMIMVIDDYWRGYEIARWINEHPEGKQIARWILGEEHPRYRYKTEKVVTLEDRFNKGEINQGVYIRSYLERCKNTKGGVTIRDLEKMLKFIGIASPGTEVLKQWLLENNFK